MFEAGGQAEPRIVILLCEHPNLLTVGRAGSRGHIRRTDQQLARERIPVRWVARGGGCVLHAPGQLAVYPIVPLEQVGWSVGQYMRRFQTAIVEALEGLRIRVETRDGSFGVRGRSGLLAAFGVGVRRWVTCHGAFINVNPHMRPYGFIDTDRGAESAAGVRPTMGCLLSERRSGARMSTVRAALVESLAAAFQSEYYYLFTGHPWLASQAGTTRESSICKT
jgi:lipoyl(octanoyl) transferase